MVGKRTKTLQTIAVTYSLEVSDSQQCNPDPYILIHSTPSIALCFSFVFPCLLLCCDGAV